MITQKTGFKMRGVLFIAFQMNASSASSSLKFRFCCADMNTEEMKLHPSSFLSYLPSSRRWWSFWGWCVLFLCVHLSFWTSICAINRIQKPCLSFQKYRAGNFLYTSFASCFNHLKFVRVIHLNIYICNESILIYVEHSTIWIYYGYLTFCTKGILVSSFFHYQKHSVNILLQAAF